MRNDYGDIFENPLRNRLFSGQKKPVPLRERERGERNDLPWQMRGIKINAWSEILIEMAKEVSGNKKLETTYSWGMFGVHKFIPVCMTQRGKNKKLNKKGKQSSESPPGPFLKFSAPFRSTVEHFHGPTWKGKNTPSCHKQRPDYGGPTQGFAIIMFRNIKKKAWWPCGKVFHSAHKWENPK